MTIVGEAGSGKTMAAEILAQAVTKLQVRAGQNCAHGSPVHRVKSAQLRRKSWACVKRCS
jgi:ABC-type glutathione transport system ATPase component